MSSISRNNTVTLNGNNQADSIIPTINIEQLINRLVSKLTSNSNVSTAKIDEFINSNIQYLIKLFSSSTFIPIYDNLEISQKIKKKRKHLS